MTRAISYIWHPRRTSGWAPFAMISLALATGCSDTTANKPTSLVIIDSVRVAETDNLYVGKPNYIATGSDGTVYVSDIADRKILQISRDGITLSVIASRGGGPGEVTTPASLAILGDTLLAVGDNSRRSIALFDLPSAHYRGDIPVGFRTSSLSRCSDATVMGSLLADSSTAYAILSDSTSSWRGGGTVPEIFRRLPMVADPFGSVKVACNESSVFGIFEVANTLHVWSRGADEADSVALPVSLRRGARTDIIEELVRDPSKAGSLAFQWSVPLLIAEMPRDRVAMIFYDPTLKDNVFSGPNYLQVANWRRHVACNEVLIPVPYGDTPRFAVRGDTLTAVVQHAAGVDGTSSWIVRWRIEVGSC